MVSDERPDDPRERSDRQRHLVVGCSLREGSHSAILAGLLRDDLAGHLGDRHRTQVEGIELAALDLPMCDDGACYDHPEVIHLRERIESASSITVATPIYNYEVGGATRNLIALTGNAWKDKVVGLMCAAGGQSSYMSVMGFANSLMLDFRCVIVPRFVYAGRSAFDEGELTDDRIRRRVSTLASELVRFSTALG